MRAKVWMHRILFHWTRKSRAIRQLAQEVGVKEGEAVKLVAKKEGEAVKLVAKIEADSVNIARERYTTENLFKIEPFSIDLSKLVIPEDKFVIREELLDLSRVVIWEKPSESALLDLSRVVIREEPSKPAPLDERLVRPSKVWLRRYLLRWTRKSRAIRQLARDFGIDEGSAFKLLIEEGSVDKTRQILELRALRALIEASSRYTEPKRPPNQFTSGARLSS